MVRPVLYGGSLSILVQLYLAEGSLLERRGVRLGGNHRAGLEVYELQHQSSPVSSSNAE